MFIDRLLYECLWRFIHHSKEKLEATQISLEKELIFF